MGRAGQAHSGDIKIKKGGKHGNQHESVWERYTPLAQKAGKSGLNHAYRTEVTEKSSCGVKPNWPQLNYPCSYWVNPDSNISIWIFKLYFKTEIMKNGYSVNTERKRCLPTFTGVMSITDSIILLMLSACRVNRDRKQYLRYVQRILIVVTCSLIYGNNLIAQQLRAPTKRPNILMIVADDMNWDSPDCFGGAAKDINITPNIDILATEGMMFQHAYENVSLCTPSRSVILTGLYPINNGAEGFQRIHPGTPTLPSILNQAGYLCGTIGKPLSQQELFRWSVTYHWQGVGDEDLWGRDPAVYRDFAKDFFAMAKTSKQPFFLMTNSHDPHRPFGGGKATKEFQERAKSSRTFSPEEVRVPGFLPDLPGVREDLAGYCTSVRRMDDMVGVVLEELTKAGLDDNTIVIFLSDNGMDFPAGKFNCYLNSVRTPLIIRWPGQIKKGSIDSENMISTVDLQPTILDAVGLPPTEVSDGRSFLPLLHGQSQTNRESIYAQFYHIHGADALPMYAVLTKKYDYIFNPWSNGKRIFKRLRNPSGRAMEEAAKTDTVMARRIRFLKFRKVEEYYDLLTDPNCFNDLLGSNKTMTTTQKEELKALRAKLSEWMVRVKEPALDAFEKRYQPDVLDDFTKSYRERAEKVVRELRTYETAKGYRF